MGYIWAMTSAINFFIIYPILVLRNVDSSPAGTPWIDHPLLAMLSVGFASAIGLTLTVPYVRWESRLLQKAPPPAIKPPEKTELESDKKEDYVNASY